MPATIRNLRLAAANVREAHADLREALKQYAETEACDEALISSAVTRMRAALVELGAKAEVA